MFTYFKIVSTQQNGAKDDFALPTILEVNFKLSINYYRITLFRVKLRNIINSMHNKLDFPNNNDVHNIYIICK